MSQDQDGPSDESIFRRRNVLRTIGGLTVFGTVGTGSAAATDSVSGSKERTITWDGKGIEHAKQVCVDADADVEVDSSLGSVDTEVSAKAKIGFWHLVLKPGISAEFKLVGDLEVTFEDGSKQFVQGIKDASGEVHFHVRKPGGGTIASASVTVVGGGQEAHLKITIGKIKKDDTLHWQVDFGEGPVKDPPRYFPDDVMAALGNSDDGVTDNPSFNRQQTEGQLKDVDIVGNAFSFDDDDDPRKVTVEFKIDEGGDRRDLHLSSFVLPGAFDEEEIEEQELFDSTVETFDGGERGKLTIMVPRRGLTLNLRLHGQVETDLIHSQVHTELTL